MASRSCRPIATARSDRARRTGLRAAGLLLGMVADAVFADPRRGHPVAGFGRAATALERRLYADRASRGVLFSGICVGSIVALGLAAERWTRDRPWQRLVITAAATWSVVGGTSLAREGSVMAELVETGQLDAARTRLSHLCARDPGDMELTAVTRASIESLAENASDAVVAPLLWGALVGVPGLLGYRAVNTLDAMVGYRSPRYRRFGWASARLDDAANLVPARVTGALVALAAPAARGSTVAALATALREGDQHPSPNAGYPEAAMAGALGVRLGGANVYGGRVEHRPVLGAGNRPVEVADLRRAVLVGRVAAALSAVLSAALSAGFSIGSGVVLRRRGDREPGDE